MSAALTVLVPTRVRPHTVLELARAFADTATADTDLMFCLDADPAPQRYLDAAATASTIYPRLRMRLDTTRRRLVGALNHHSAALLAAANPPTALAYLGDDHRPVTAGWDTAYLTALAAHDGIGLVYGDDGHQGVALPTQVAIGAPVITALGYFAPPVLTHMYCDNFWKDLGAAAGALTYLPDVLITHQHPGAGHGGWDDSYRESNSAASYARDAAAYAAFAADGSLTAAIDTVRALRELR